MGQRMYMNAGLGMATGRVFSGTRPAPPLMGWDKNVLNGFGTGMGCFLKPGAGSGRVWVFPHSAPPRPAPVYI